MHRGEAVVPPQLAARRAVASLATALLVSCGGGDAKAPTPPASQTPVLTTLSLTLTASTVNVGQSVLASATGVDQNGAPIATGTVTWTSSASGVATVSSTGSSTGNVVAVGAGQAQITASSGGKQAQSTITVVSPPVASIVVSPSAVTLNLGATQQLTATAFDANGAPLLGKAITWTSSDNSKATVSSAGLVSAVGGGAAVVTGASEGKSATAAINVLSTTGRDISIASASVTQGVQDAQGTMPVVLNGSAAVVNVYLEATPPVSTPMQVVLRLFNASGVLIRADTAVVSRSLFAGSDASAPSAQFLVAASQLTTGLRWQVVRDPKGLVPDESAANDVFPRAGPATLATTIVPTLNVRFVPIVLTSHNNATGTVNAGNMPTYLRSVRSVHPLGIISTHVGTSFSTGASFGTPPSGGASTFWTQVLSELDLARVADPVEPTINWYGVIVPPAGFNFTQFGGFSYIPSNGTSTGPSTRTSLSVQLNWFSNQTQARDLVAHELGHTFGRRHAPCGNPSGVDTSYPVSGGVLDALGFDVYSWENGLASSAVAVPTTTGDVMGYCFPVWSSTYTYAGVLAFRGTAAASTAVLGGAPPAAMRRRSLVVRGIVDSAKSLTLEPSYVLDAIPTPSDPGGTHRVEGRSADGRVLFSARVTPSAIDHAPGVGHFTIVVPMTDEIAEALQSLVLLGPEGIARRERAGIAPALLAAAGSVRRRSNGNATASCGPTAAGVLVLDSRGTVLGSASAASAVVRAAPGAALTLVCSDGVRSARSTHRVQ